MKPLYECCLLCNSFETYHTWRHAVIATAVLNRIDSCWRLHSGNHAMQLLEASTSLCAMCCALVLSRGNAAAYNTATAVLGGSFITMNGKIIFPPVLL